MADYSVKTIWNFDEARMKELHYHMVLCEEAFTHWDISGINRELQSIRRITSAAFGETEWKDLVDNYKKLEKLKREISNAVSDSEHNQKQIQYYNLADEIFIKINRSLKLKGMFFRVGDDPRFAALKR